jgi:NAD-dependent dihydropyrimidine dehydrogenase PreA subunit
MVNQSFEKKTEIKNNTKLPKQLPWVIPVNCEGCGDCVNKCKKGCLQMTETNVEGVFVPWMEHPEECIGCGQCANTCVMGAIVMTEYVEMALNRFLEQKPTIPT